MSEGQRSNLTSGAGHSHREWVEASLTRRSRLDWRELVLRGLHYSGALGLARRIADTHEIVPGSRFPHRWQRAADNKFVILCYHGIGDAGNPLGLAPSPQAFEAQMRFLRRHYRILSLEDLFRELREPRRCKPAVAVTFDDGYESAYSAAFPILKKYAVPATIYVTVECIETGEAAWYDRIFHAIAVAPRGELRIELDRNFQFQLHSREDRWQAALELVAYLRTLPNPTRKLASTKVERIAASEGHRSPKNMLSWNQIREMRSAGIAFGSHTWSHPVVSQLEPEELAQELAGSKQLLEAKLGCPAPDFAFPFGKPTDYNAQAIARLSGCGYRSAVTTTEGANTAKSNVFELRRVQVGHDASLARFSFALNQAFLRSYQPQQTAPSPQLVQQAPTPVQPRSGHMEQPHA